MSFLIDTHAFLWYIQASDQLSQNAVALLEDLTNNLYLSIASLWETAITGYCKTTSMRSASITPRRMGGNTERYKLRSNNWPAKR